MKGPSPAVVRVAGAADVGLVARVLRLAASGVVPGGARKAIARLLAEGWNGGLPVLLDALERSHGALSTDTGVQAAAAALGAHDAQVLLVGQPGYPARLATAWPELGAPPWVFARTPPTGVPGGPAVAVVGTRQATADGLATATELARLLARHGVLVVSGMARGIDQAAHRGALAAGGRTVGVLGTGFGVDYPRGDARLRAAVVAAGGLLTEYLPDVGVRKPSFLWRNRIISGMADATVVVEGRKRSGALQTARLAAGQGRDVLAVPGSLNQPTARGPLDLIRDGATPITRLTDVLDAIGVEHDIAIRPAGSPPSRAGELPPASAAVVKLLGATPADVTTLAQRTGLSIGAVLGAVADLEARGLARTTPRGAVRVHPPDRG